MGKVQSKLTSRRLAYSYFGMTCLTVWSIEILSAPMNLAILLSSFELKAQITVLLFFIIYGLLALSCGINNSLFVAGSEITQTWSEKRRASSLSECVAEG